ncbi:MAG TPA: biotin carboxylase N-terminal domain-containing protein [Steroidobacteraceae bacterium]|nr:biotin carboxylase N-terminal domain-containing protein [Steroidobacteraceae bacterium]
MTLRRLLIANRGEIAVRIIRTCERLGIESVLAASEADLDSLPARLADRTVCIGPPPAGASYLDAQAIIAAGKAARVDALHPGYGFLSENARFARLCRAAGILYVGPTDAQLDAVGDKLRAREQAARCGLPILPGGAVASAQEAAAIAERIGWPILIKAVGGGGGRGMKPVREPAELPRALELAIAEARGAFADPRVYVERFIASARHIEVQLLGDGVRIAALGERDCSVQRRYQKLLEEAPAPRLPEQLRARLKASALTFGRHLGYCGAGTVEFLVDAARGEFYFLEMNARIQVEHPVTEAVTGLDIVAWQIAIAEGRALAASLAEVPVAGHALECRINAEDPARDFRPSPGTITRAVFPAGPGIRIDTHIEAGASVPPYYDSLLAKIIVHAPERLQCLERMRTALAATRIEGVATNLAVHAALIDAPELAEGGVDTAFCARFIHAMRR